MFPFLALTKPIGPQCNLDCQYCFYLRKESLFDKSVAVMDDETLENWVKFYIQHHKNLPQIHFIWQGGEPLLCGLDFFKKVIEYQNKYKPQTATISNAIQTNATLITEEWAQFLKQHNFLAGVSIDGPCKLHDAYRMDRRKKGTYELVVKGLRRLQKHGVELNALVVVNTINGRHPKEVYNHLVDLGFEHIQFIPCVEPVSIKGKIAHTTSWSIKPDIWGDFLNHAFDEWYRQNHFRKIHVQIFDIQLNIHRNILPSLCTFQPECGRVPVVEHNGDFYSCDHFVEPRWRLGNINRAPIESLIYSEKQKEFGEIKYKKLPRNCKQCPWLQRCWGDCPKNRFIPDKNNPPKAYLCKGWKKFFRYTDSYFKEIILGENF